MTIRFWRSGTPSFGLEVNDDDTARSWLSGGAAVGRFARELTAAERAALERGLAAASADGAATPPRPSRATEHLLVNDSIDIVYDVAAGPPDGCRELVGTLRDLLDDLVASPVAALVLDVAGPPYRAELRHGGNDPITVRMDGLTMTTTRFGPGDTVEATTESRIETERQDGPVGPGWTLPLSDAGGAAASGGFVAITVGPAEVDVQGDGVLRRIEFGWASE